MSDIRLLMPRVLAIADKLAENEPRASYKHFEGCWRVHDACALRKVHDLLAEYATQQENEPPECTCDGGEQGDGLCALPHDPSCPVAVWQNRPL